MNGASPGQAAALAITGSSLERTHQLGEARRCLEVEMAGWAAERVTPEELSVIGQPYRSDTSMDRANPGRFPTSRDGAGAASSDI